ARLQGHHVRSSLPASSFPSPCSRHTVAHSRFASTLRTLSPQRKSRLCVQDYPGFHVPLFRRLLLLTPGVLGSSSSYVVSIHHRLLRPHAPVSQARCDFTPLRLYAAPSLCGNT